MASCQGQRKMSHTSSTATTCYNALYKCKKCGNVGCSQTSPGLCTSQGFSGDKCLKCGAQSSKETFK